MIEILWMLFDSILLVVLLILAWVACSTSDLKRGVTLFIAFGLLLAVTWARLGAPDVALAEAIIGAGISGALLLTTLKDYPHIAPQTNRSVVVTWGINLLTLALFILISSALWHALSLSSSIRLSEAVTLHLADSGVSNPVTAVLLNFRAYDTLLELAVVLTAVLTVLSLGVMRPSVQPAGVLLTGMLRWLVPLLIVSSGYLLWVGAHAPGGAFHAGAMLAAAIILIQQGNQSSINPVQPSLLRWLLVSGIAIFVIVGVLMMLLNNSFLDYSQGWSGMLILLIEFAATFSIAAALSLAYLGGRPNGWEPSQSNHSEKLK